MVREQNSENLKHELVHVTQMKQKKLGQSQRLRLRPILRPHFCMSA